MKSPDEIIHQIIADYPESEWLKVCRAALPDISDGEIASIIEVMSGGDVLVIDEASTMDGQFSNTGKPESKP